MLSDAVATEMGDSDLNVRVLKPFCRFYNLLAATVFKYGLKNLATVDLEDFVEAINHSMKKEWRSDLKTPIRAFYELCKEEAGKEEYLALENVRYKMRQAWETQIIKRSDKFKKARIEQS